MGLALTEPMPSMPVSFWAEPDGSRLRADYFGDYQGGRNGDWIKVTSRGSCVVYGRSDSTLNRRGVRRGTADFHAVVEGFDEVADSLVIDTRLGGRGCAVCRPPMSRSGRPVGAPGAGRRSTGR